MLVLGTLWPGDEGQTNIYVHDSVQREEWRGGSNIWKDAKISKVINLFI